MPATTANQITEYRRHAAAQRRMVTARNRVHLAGDQPVWTERSLLASEAHQEARSAIDTALRDAGHGELADALNAEAQVRSTLAWSTLSGKDDVATLTAQLAGICKIIRAATVTPAAEQVTEFRRHAAAVRRLTRRASDSARTQEALVEHRDACANLAADLDTDLAFALESEHHYLERAASYRANGGGEWLGERLAVVRRVIRRAVR